MRQTLGFLFILSVLLIACGAPAVAPTATSPATALVAAPPATAPIATSSATAPAVTSTRSAVPTSDAIPQAGSSPTPSPVALPAATLRPIIPPPAVIGLDNFSQLASLHDYTPDIEAVIKVQAPDFAAFAPIYSPDSQHFAAPISLPDGTRALLVLDVATGDLVASAEVDEGVKKVFSWSFSPDGQKLLYSTYPDGKINIWDIAGQKLDRVLWSKKGYVISDVATSPDGKQILAVVGDSQSSTGRLLMVWDAANGDLVKQIPANTQYGVDISQFSADGRRLILSTQAGGKELTVYDTSTWKAIARIHPAEMAVISPDGAFVLTSKQAGGDILLWDAGTGKQISSLKNPFEETAGMVFSPDGSMLIVTGTPPFKPHTDNVYLDAGIWDTSTWQQIGIQHWGKTESLLFSPDGRSLLAHYQGTIYRIGFPDPEIQTASRTAVDFTTALGKGDYTTAASSFSINDLERANLKDKGLATDPTTLLETICKRNAFPCLPATVIYSTRYPGEGRNAEGYYGFLVRFTNPDGTIYSDADGATLFELFVSPDPNGALRVDDVVADVVAVMQK